MPRGGVSANMRHLFITKSRITTDHDEMDDDEVSGQSCNLERMDKSRTMPASLCVGLSTLTLTS